VYAGGRAGEGEGGFVRDDQPQTYIRGPNIYKHHVRIGATCSPLMRSVTEFASRPLALRLVRNYVPACPVSVIAWTPRSQERKSGRAMRMCPCSEDTFLDSSVAWLRTLGAVVGPDSGPSR